MKKSGLFLVIIILFGLSLGPLTYFLGGNDEMEFPEDNGEAELPDEPEFNSFFSEFSGELKEMDSYIHFEVLGDDNTLRSEIEEVVSEIPIDLNYSVSSPSLTVNDKWSYEGEVAIDDDYGSKRIGFELNYYLSHYFDDLTVYRDSKVIMPSEITGRTQEGDVTDIDTGNMEIESELVYSHLEGEEVKLICPELIVDSEGSLIEVASKCIQTEPHPEYGYGVTEKHFQEDGKIIEKNRSLNVLEVIKYRSKITYQDENISEDILEEIKELTVDIDVDEESKVISISSEDESSFKKSIDYVEENELLEFFEEPSKEIVVELPEEETLNNENYPLKEMGFEDAVTHVSFDSGDEVNLNISYKLIYGRLIDVEIL